MSSISPLSDQYLCPISYKELTDPVGIFPCTHKFDKVTASQIFKLKDSERSSTDIKCPLCSRSIVQYSDDPFVSEVVFKKLNKDPSIDHLKCPKTKTLLNEPVSLFPCNHKMSKKAAQEMYGECSLGEEFEKKKNCPSCEQLVSSYSIDYFAKNEVEDISQQDNTNSILEQLQEPLIDPEKGVFFSIGASASYLLKEGRISKEDCKNKIGIADVNLNKKGLHLYFPSSSYANNLTLALKNSMFDSVVCENKKIETIHGLYNSIVTFSDAEEIVSFISLNCLIPLKFISTLSKDYLHTQILGDEIIRIIELNTRSSIEKSQDGSNEKLTTILVDCHVPEGSQLFIRGNGAGLSWHQGIRLEKINDSYVFHIKGHFEPIEYKLLLGDVKWENSSNHSLTAFNNEHIHAYF